MEGSVVRAQRGERHAYRPITSKLCTTASDPVGMAQALVRLYSFTSLYIADLDAIQRCGTHVDVVAAIRRALPAVDIWVDAGIADIDDCRPWIEIGVRCVVGSESQLDTNHAIRLIEQLGDEHAILSLDDAHGQFKGPVGLFENIGSWPQRVINMTLGRVGSYEGPDIEKLQQLQDQAQDRRIYAAGGVRDIADIERLASLGIAGALLASALHDEKITPEQLERLDK